MANPARLASAAAFDLRLKGADEPRWVALRYAPDADRERLCALYCLGLECQRALAASEPMLGRIRIQWWRETLETLAAGGSPRRHDLTEEISRTVGLRSHVFEAALRLLDAYDEVIDDHAAAGGHQPGEAHEARHLALGGRLSIMAGLALSPVATDHAAALEAIGEAEIAWRGGLASAEDRMTRARRAARAIPAVLWPAIAHLAVRDCAQRPLSMRTGIFVAMLFNRL
jgi:phytoene synthase